MLGPEADNQAEERDIEAVTGNAMWYMLRERAGEMEDWGWGAWMGTELMWVESSNLA